MTAKSSAHAAWKRVRTMVGRFWGTIGGKSAGVPFAEGSRTFNSTTQCWVHTSGWTGIPHDQIGRHFQPSR
jgi:hypothetical protein